MSRDSDWLAASYAGGGEKSGHPQATEQDPIYPLIKVCDPMLVGGLAPDAFAGPDAGALRDRAAAARELAGMFRIGGGAGGEAMPNDVSQAQFDEICRMYSDIRLGRGSLKVDFSSLLKGENGEKAEATARGGAMKDLSRMLQTEAGRGLVRELLYNKHETVIKAFHQDANGNGDRDDDDGAPLDWSNAQAIARHYQSAFTCGKGTGSDVHYNPGMVVAGSRSDITLMHEMRHALDETRGSMDSRLVAEIDGVSADVGLSRYEHQATGLGVYANSEYTENAYRAERMRMGKGGARGVVRNNDVTDDALLDLRRTYRHQHSSTDH